MARGYLSAGDEIHISNGLSREAVKIAHDISHIVSCMAKDGIASLLGGEIQGPITDLTYLGSEKLG